MRGIYNKELTQYFTSAIGYIFIAVFLSICGLFFYLTNLASQNSDIKVFFSSIITFLMFLIPILTMRSYAEEKKGRTEELLLTAPIELSQIIGGKFLASCTIFAIPLALTFSFPIIISIFGECEVLVSLGNYLGLLLIGATFISIGLFVSILSENQIVAAIVTYCILLVLFSLNQVVVMLGDNLISQILNFLSINTHLVKLTYGVLDLTDLVFFISTTLLFLFLSVLVLDRKRRL